jgi:diguanylate cyclase (GGDEF)-like protein
MSSLVVGMKNQPVLIVCSMAIAVLLAIAVLGRTVLIESFEKIEADLIDQSIVQVRKALHADLKQLEVSNRDYAQWDDAYRFMAEGDRSYIDSNYQPETLEGLQVDLVWIVDAAGRDVYSVEHANGAATTTTPARPALLDVLRPAIAKAAFAEEQPPVNRILRFDGRLLAFSLKPILRTDLSGPALGHLVWARFIEKDEVARLRETSQLPLEILDLGSDSQHAALPARVTTWLAGNPAVAAGLAVPYDSQRIDGYALLHDLDHKQTALLATHLRRSVLMLGERTTLMLVAVVAVLVICFAAIVLALFGRLARTSRARQVFERQLRENQRKLAHLAHHDSLTGLPNRLYLQSRLPRALARATRTETQLALLYIDIDNFKNINDSRGHGSGDSLLRLIAQRLRNAVSDRDLVIRMGGDEFVVVAAGLADRTGIEAIGQRLMAALGAPFEVDGATFTLTVSVGASVYPEDGLDLEVLLKHADIALYQAKDRGRNNLQFFVADMNVRLMERVALEQALRRAIGTEQIYLEYQPIVDVANSVPLGLEALLRWHHPEFGLVPPGRFIPVAESCGAIVDLGEQVLRLVCMQLRDWSAAGIPVLPVSINVSPRQLDRTRLQDTVEKLTTEFAIDPRMLSFEITEGAVMHDAEQHLGTLHTLRRLGSRIAVDDFGTGYSSLSYLKHLPIDALKIDRAFVRDMASDANDAAIVAAIIGMARTLGLRTVAEGVETVDQLERLRTLGCDSAQGYLFSRPMSVRACTALLQSLGSGAAATQAREDTGRRRALRLVRT